MNFMDYEKNKIKQLSAAELVWKLFELTGGVNYARLHLALTNEKVMEAKSHKSQDEPTMTK